MGWGFLFLAVLVVAENDPPQTIDDLKVGDCLTFSDMQRLIGVRSKDVYLAGEGECKIAYDLEEPVSQEGVCADPWMVGYWTRETKEHPKFGMFFPFAPPCYTSVTSVDYMDYRVSRLNPLEEGAELPACIAEDLTVTEVQTEKFITKKWEVGQGSMYLPNPLVVRRENFVLDPDLGFAPSSCADKKLVVTYRGWGSFESTWWEYKCGVETPTKCRVARMKSAENDEGQTCVEITKINECSTKRRFTPFNP